MANCLDEISCQDVNIDSERILSNNEWQKLQKVHQQVIVAKQITFMRMRRSLVLGKAYLHHVSHIYRKGLSMDLNPPYNTV